MNNKEANELLLRELRRYEELGYQELEKMVDQHSARFKVTGPSGVSYQIQIRVVWDDKPLQAVRILGAIDDGGWRSFVPLGYGVMVDPPPKSMK
jgi:hypothetical protein